ncbi:Angiogenin-2 like [Heracleum sosnowskyi]|uniref:Angiogenin-2 like n=1 Tax=Heracleum sosnowskyi TaxID=360622 RepID=A0AAD8IHD0_9APIA|nr:Angiogenin-2 like [Heracleum sosnowskyi]KAK1385884.1 Angiogenin-2 like [Heracleum sosnowskyi]
MNPMFDRECSSGCESGWTSYLDHEDSFLSPYPSQKSGDDYIKQDEDDYEEEDMSMVSDASSGPPHFRDDEYFGNDLSNNGFFIQTPSDATLPKNNGTRKKNSENRRQRVQEQQLSLLDDTASSPIFNISSNNIALSNNQASTENMLDFSQAHSSTRYEGKTRFQEHYGFCKSPVSGTKLQQNQWIERKRVGMR